MNFIKRLATVRILLTFFLFFNLQTSYAQENGLNKAKMDSLFILIDEGDRGMGSISIFSQGQEVYSKSIGYADVEKELKADHSTLYRIGSISKMFTASICMKMVEEKKLSLNSKLSKYFPDVQNAKKISIELMLKHRSGIFNITNSDDYFDWMENEISKEEMLKKIASKEPSFEPDKKAGYSNSNYILLTYILEEVGGMPFPELVQEYVCKPCGLELSKYGDPINTSKNEAQSYEYANQWKQSTETHPSVPLGAGGIVSTPTELNQFLNCLFQGKIVSSENVELMMQVENNFGIGMFTVPFYDKKAYGHTGGVDGFVSNAFYFPDDSVSIAYTSNGTRTPVNNIMLGALSIYYNKDYTLPEYKESVVIDAKELDQYLGVYSSPTFPLKITISREENVLYAQATSQPKFILEALGNHEFQYETAALKMTFQPENNVMIFKQMGFSYELKKE